MIDTKEPRLPRGWRMTPFDELLRRVERPLLLDDAETYRCVGVRWYGAGAFVRERLPGLSIARKQQWVIRKGDVVYNKLFAWKGAFAIADSDVDDCIVSDKFPTYTVDQDLVEPEFLFYFFRTAALRSQAESLSRGAAAISKFTLNPPAFWRLRLPRPPLPEQRRLVSQLHDFDAKIREARRLRDESGTATEALLAAQTSTMVDPQDVSGKLGDVLSGAPRNGWSARCNNADGGIPVLSLGAVRGFEYRPSEFKRTLEPTRMDAHYWLRDGDLLMTRSNTPELVGHAAIYNGVPAPCIYPDLMMRLVVNDQKADKEFVHFWLMSRPVREYIRRTAKGTSATMKKISQSAVMNIPFPSHMPRDRQQAIVRTLKVLRVQLKISRDLQTRSASEIDALMPTALTAAFRGEL